MAEHPLTPEERAARRAQLRRQYRRRRLTALGVVVVGLIGAGALLAGFVFGGDSVRASQQEELGTSTDCEPTSDPQTVRPSWVTARRQTVLVDSVLLGGNLHCARPSSAGSFASSASRPSCCRPWRSASPGGIAWQSSSCSASATTRSGNGGGATTRRGPGSSTPRRRSFCRRCARRERASSSGSPSATPGVG